jgi:hypothetical protein
MTEVTEKKVKKPVYKMSKDLTFLLAGEGRAVRMLFLEAAAHAAKVKNSSVRRADVGVARGADQDDGT